MSIDRRGILEAEPFSFQITKDKKVRIFYKNNEVKIISGKSAINFISKIEIFPIKEQQLMMAKITGNFKHGNERESKNGKKWVVDGFSAVE